MTHHVIVLNIVGLTPSLMGPDTPHLNEVARSGFQARLETVLPAVTCSVQASMLTGLMPRDHGIVGNGWYFRDLAEVWFWRQSNRLVSGENLWDALRRQSPGATTAQLFWWYAMGSTADIAVTPRPAYPADGRKIPDIYTVPADLRSRLNQKLGPFPLFHFWGPAADIRSSEWIADSALDVFDTHRPALTLVYLPHLDYNLQRLGPRDPRIAGEVRAIDHVAGKIIRHARSAGAEVVVLSEYGITPVTGAVAVNRRLRDENFLAIHDSQAGEILDPGASRAFAVADHQIAHIYVRHPEDIPAVRRLLEQTDGIERVLDEAGKKEFGLDHPRSGELVALAAPDRWFSYYYWLDDRRAPDFARTVDIHRKPGYDPVELFLDPAIPLPRLKIAWKLLKKSLGFRTLMDVISLDASLVRGSHGRLPSRPEDGPVLLSTSKSGEKEGIHVTEVKDLILSLCR